MKFDDWAMQQLIPIIDEIKGKQKTTKKIGKHQNEFDQLIEMMSNLSLNEKQNRRQQIVVNLDEIDCRGNQSEEYIDWILKQFKLKYQRKSIEELIDKLLIVFFNEEEISILFDVVNQRLKNTQSNDKNNPNFELRQLLNILFN